MNPAMRLSPQDVIKLLQPSLRNNWIYSKNKQEEEKGGEEREWFIFLLVCIELSFFILM